MLAIVIPYFKLTFFQDTLESLSNQTDKKFKVYIGDDASPECPKQLLEKFKNKLDFKYQRFETNLGGTSLVKQWERCIDLIEDEKWILILGDDDCFGDKVVESWYANYDTFKEKSNVVRFATKVVEEQKGVISSKYKHPTWEKATASYYRNFKGLTRSSLSEYVFSRKAYSEKGFKNYPLAWCSDDQAWLDFSGKKKIYSINSSIVYIRISDLSITGSDHNYLTKLESLSYFYKNNIEFYLKEYPKELQFHFLKYFEIYSKMYRKLNIDDWKFLLKYYISSFRLIPFFKFIRRYIIFIFKT